MMIIMQTLTCNSEKGGKICLQKILNVKKTTWMYPATRDM